jgi:DNA-binding GntR family transcriptional regulator
MAAIFLDSHGAGLHEIVEAIGPIRLGVARLASRNRDPLKLDKMRAFLRQEQAFDDGENNDRDLLTAEREFNALLAEMSGNRVLGLFTDMLRSFTEMAVGGPGLWSESSERIEQYRRLRNRMAEAIIEGDEEIVALTASRAETVLMEWMMESVSETRRAQWRS